MNSKVEFIITGLAQGGAERQLLNLIRSLSEYNQLDISVTVLKVKSFYSSAFSENGIKIRYLEGDLLKIMYYIFSSAINKEEVFYSTWLYHSDLVGLSIKLLNPSVKLSWNVRTAEISKKYGFITFNVIRVLRLFSRFPDFITFNSERGIIVHEEFGYSNANMIYFPNSISDDFYSYSVGIPQNNKIIIGVFGRSGPQKGYDVLFKALKLSKHHVLDAVNIIFAGDNYKDVDVVNICKCYGYENLGIISDMPNLYSKINMILLPSCYGEGTSNVIIEGLASGVPCLATDVGDNSSILENKYGVVIKPNDPQVLATTLEYIVEVGGLYNFLNIESKFYLTNYAKRRFSSKKNAELFMRLIN